MGRLETSTVRDTGRPAAGRRQTGPMVARLLLGSRLRRLREAAGVSCVAAGEHIRGSGSKISRLELGRTGFKEQDVSDLLELYGVSDEAERATMLALLVQARVPGWWQEYGDLVPGWMNDYIGLEQAASVIRGYAVQVVPPLLQTLGYAEAVIRSGLGPEAGLHPGRWAELRMRRQGILYDARPASLWFVIDEVVLRRPVGDVGTLRAQLRHLLDLIGLPHVTVQVMPLDPSGQAAPGGHLTIMRMPEPELPDVAYLERSGGPCHPVRPAELDHYRHLMNSLVTEAAPAKATRAILHRILAEI